MDLTNNQKQFVEDYLEEITSELARVGRPDLIRVLRNVFLYTTESEESSEDISTEEEELNLEVQQLGHGHCQLK